MPLIALLSDYGLGDHYVGVVKSVILGICPEVVFIDITHELAPYDVKDGAYVLLQASKYLPRGCDVLAVVDPGVNTDRRAIAVKTKERLYVGPDNGLLYPAASREGILAVYDVGRGAQLLSEKGTFAGRDVFAPTIACAAKGMQLGRLGKEVDGMAVLEFPGARYSPDAITGEVLHLDRFGNAVTNIEGEGFHAWRKGEAEFELLSGERAARVRLASSYQEIDGTGIIVGSGGALEVSRREGGPGFVLKRGDGFSLELVSKPRR
ncbi:MAG TPA: SAM-dependent chlorinase/fluorinase [Conexivisphaerales archaeon]|nr:SAM-dependent chlorinase/fluorinase [Conexivisphaerales archaeon]